MAIAEWENAALTQSDIHISEELNQARPDRHITMIGHAAKHTQNCTMKELSIVN